MVPIIWCISGPDPAPGEGCPFRFSVDHQNQVAVPDLVALTYTLLTLHGLRLDTDAPKLVLPPIIRTNMSSSRPEADILVIPASEVGTAPFMIIIWVCAVPDDGLLRSGADAVVVYGVADDMLNIRYIILFIKSELNSRAAILFPYTMVTVMLLSSIPFDTPWVNVVSVNRIIPGPVIPETSPTMNRVVGMVAARLFSA